MKSLTIEESKSITNKELANSIKSMLKTANRINFESDTEINTNNVKYFLIGDYTGVVGSRVNHRFKEDGKGGIKSSIPISRANKEQLRKMYNDLTGYINSDVDSTLAVERQRIGTEKFIKFVNDDEMINENGYVITEDDTKLMFDLKDAMPELFDGNSTFYELVVIACAEYRNAKGQFNRSLIRIAMDEKKRLEKSGKAYTMDDLKKSIINNIENGKSEKEYNTAKKKDRKSARLNRKAKRNRKA